MKAPDEIKKGMKCCVDNLFCIACPYKEMEFGECMPEMLKDALAYIQQLDAERHAAVSDLKKHVGCAVCKHYKTGAHGICLECYRDNELFEWRGIGGA